MSILIAGYEIDVAIVQEPTFRSEITNHRVERGPSITDHRLILPTVLTIEGFVSDAPSGPIEARRTPGVVPSQESYRFLKDLFFSNEPFEIETTQDVFDSMLMETLTPPTTTQDGFRFRATFQQVVFVSNERTTIPVAAPGANKKVKRGAQAPRDQLTRDDVARMRGYSSNQQMAIDEDKFFKRHKRRPEIEELAAGGNSLTMFSFPGR